MGTVLQQDTRLTNTRSGLLLMMSFHEIMVLIRKTTAKYAARCALYTAVGSLLSLPSSIHLGTALSVTTSDWLLCLSRAIESKHLKLVRLQIFSSPMSTRLTSRTSCTSTEWQAMHRSKHVLLGCLEIGQMVNETRSSIPDHKLNTKLLPSTPSNTDSPR